MAFLGLFKNKKRTLNDLSADELNRERIAIEQEQRKLDREATMLDRDHSQLISEYAAAGTDSMKRIIARKLQGIDLRQKAADAKSAHCHKMLQTVSNFLILKDRMEFFEKLNVGKLLKDLDIAEVEQLISEATIDGQLQEDKLATMLQQLDDANEQLMAGQQGPLDDYMAKLDAQVASAAQAGVKDDGLGDYMAGLDAQLEKGANIAKNLKAKRPMSDEG